MIVVIVNQKGGTGKTTVAINLAFGTASVKLPTALVDADEQRTCLHFYEDYQTEYLHLYPGGDDIKKTVGKLQEKYIFVDTAPHDNDAMYLAMVEADLVIIPTQASPYDLHSSERTIEVLREVENSYGHTPCYFLLNRLKPNTILGRETLDYITNNFQLPILKTQLHDYELYKQAPLTGKSVFQYAPNHKASKELANLLVEMGKLYKSYE